MKTRWMDLSPALHITLLAVLGRLPLRLLVEPVVQIFYVIILVLRYRVSHQYLLHLTQYLDFWSHGRCSDLESTFLEITLASE